MDLPSGDTRGSRQSKGPRVSWVRLVPSTPTDQIWKLPSR